MRTQQMDRVCWICTKNNLPKGLTTSTPLIYILPMLITAEKLVEIIKEKVEKDGATTLANEIGVSRQAIANVTSGRTSIPYGKIPSGLGYRRVVMFERVKK